MTSEAEIRAAPAAPAEGAYALASPWRHLYTFTGLALLVGLLYLVFGFSGYGELTVDQYVRGLASPEPRMRWLAAMALGQKLGPESGAARAAAGTGLDQARVALERVVGADQHPVVRAAAATALQSLGTPASIPALAKALDADAVGTVRQCAAGALAKLGTDAAIGPLVDALDDADPEVRSTSARALVALGPEARSRGRERAQALASAGGAALTAIFDAEPQVAGGEPRPG